ncbi:Small subunit processome complex component [Trapelia coarctata]|nr:Small subunit processome complex component [Trapelia coarctata]
MTPQQIMMRRIFSLYHQDPCYRIPQGGTVGSCAIGFDITNGNQDTITTSWEDIKQHIAKFLSDCVVQRHVGGYMYMDGMVFLVTNPTQVSGWGTCMASSAAHHGRPVPRRLNLAECMVTHGLGSPPPAPPAVVRVVGAAGGPRIVTPAPPRAAVQEVGAASGPRIVTPAASQNSQNYGYRPPPMLPPSPPSLAALNPAYFYQHGNTFGATDPVSSLPNPFGAARNNRLGAAQMRPPLPTHPLAVHNEAGPSRPVAGAGFGFPGAFYLPPGGGQGPPRGRSPAPREGSPIGSQGSVYGANLRAGQRGGIGPAQGAPRVYQGVGPGAIRGGAQGGGQWGVQGGAQDPPPGHVLGGAQGGAQGGAARGVSPGDSGGSSMETISQSMPVFSSMFTAPPLTSERIMDMWLWRRPRWFHTNRGNGREEVTWQRDGAFMAIKLKGQSEPFPLLIPQFRQPARKCYVKMPWRAAREQKIWAWKATGLQWEHYSGQIPTNEYHVVQESGTGGWILVKFAMPPGLALTVPAGSQDLPR